MEVEVIIKGGDKLSRYYPKKYEEFEDKMGEMILDFFPGVEGYIFGSEMNNEDRAHAEAREKLQEKRLERDLIEILKKPEMQALLKEKLAPLIGAA